ncbi:MAG: DUF1156 domain-containing protein [Ignavibacteriae bacterium]|nr:DUF1156 domain-containing protein [Ignavibacteriota bacterium]
MERVKKRIGHLYPQGKDGKPVIGYLWARTAPCSNPSCKKEIPLIRSLLVCDKKLKRVALTMNIESRRITFSIAKGKEIHRTEGTMLTRGNVRCPFCEETTPVADLRTAGLNGKLGEQLLCAIVETNDGKDYRPIEKTDIEGFQEAVRISHAVERPNEKHADSNEAGLRCHNYGYKTFGSMYNGRQLVAMQTFVDETKKTLVVLPQNSISEGLTIYLGLWVSRMSMRFTNMGRFDSGGESFQSPFSTQAIPMIWDYAEPNPFSDSTGGAHNQINWIRGVLEREQFQYFENSQSIQCSNGDGANLSVANKAVDVVVTDPPYFDSIAYADLSDFFYIWLKRVLVEMSPTIFTTPLTPKSEEATSLKHRHEGSEEIANQHFENKLADCLAESKRLCKDDGVIAVMFAHQSTLAWTALINAIFKSRLNVIATYPIDTELANRSVALAGSALSSSVTVICRHRVYGAAASYKDVRIEIEKVVKESVEKFWRYGFRGADLIVACYGPAVGVVGKYEYVEKQGEPVPIGELLEEVRKIALSAIAGAFTGDLSSRFYFVVANIYKTSETQWDDMRLVAQIGCGEEDARKFSDEYHFIIREGDKARLALLRDRENDISSPDQVNEKSPLIDQLHCAMVLWKNEKRTELVRFLHSGARMENDILWKLAQSLFEVLPPETEDRKLINALLSEREALRVETKSLRTKEETQIGLGI